MRVPVFLLISFFILTFASPVLAQTRVFVQSDTVEVKAERTSDSRTIGYLYYGDIVEYVQSIGDWIILPGGGYIPKMAVQSELTFIERAVPSSEIKELEDLSQEELTRLLLEANATNRQLQQDVNTIKGIQIYFASVTTVGVIAALISIASN